MKMAGNNQQILIWGPWILVNVDFLFLGHARAAWIMKAYLNIHNGYLLLIYITLSVC